MADLDLGTGTMAVILFCGICLTTEALEGVAEEGLELEAEDFGEVDIREGVAEAEPEAVIPLERERVCSHRGSRGWRVRWGW